MKRTVWIAAGLLAAMVGSAHAQTVTGCLSSKGALKNVAIGGAPSKACGGTETQVTLGAAGPRGADGPLGPAGTPGAAGAPGVPGAPSGPPTYVFAGFSTQERDGAVGIPGMNEACQDAHGTEA